MNPLIGLTPKETIENASEALSALMALLAHSDNNLARLMHPIVSALEHAIETRETQ